MDKYYIYKNKLTPSGRAESRFYYNHFQNLVWLSYGNHIFKDAYMEWINNTTINTVSKYG